MVVSRLALRPQDHYVMILVPTIGTECLLIKLNEEKRALAAVCGMNRLKSAKFGDKKGLLRFI